MSGLRVKYPNLSPHYENKINEDSFKQLRLILRKNALKTLPNGLKALTLDILRKQI